MSAKLLFRSRPAAFAIAVLFLVPAALPAAQLEFWDRFLGFARASSEWADGGIRSLFAPQGSLWDPNGAPLQAPSASQSPEGLFAQARTAFDPNGQPAPAAAQAASVRIDRHD